MILRERIIVSQIFVYAPPPPFKNKQILFVLSHVGREKQEMGSRAKDTTRLETPKGVGGFPPTHLKHLGDRCWERPQHWGRSQKRVLGPMGSKSPMGPMGPTGPMGPMGRMGLMGPMGPIGPMGPMEPMGPSTRVCDHWSSPLM